MSLSLTDFQNKLTQSFENTQVSPDAFVAITLDDDLWLIDINHLKQASVPPKISKNVGAPDWVIGIANFKGEVWTVLDMRILLKNEVTLNPKWGWVTLIRPKNDHYVALLWSEIVEIAPKEEYSLASSDNLEKWCKNHWTDKGGRLWRELDVDQIIETGGLIDLWKTQKNNNMKTHEG